MQAGGWIRRLGIAALFCLVIDPVHAQTLSLPPRPANAPTGSEFVRAVTPLDLAAREQEIYAQVMAGNVPDFLRKLCPVVVSNVVDRRTNTATFYVTPDYLAIGSDADYFLEPISPNLGQRLANHLDCSLPTTKMVDAIYANAAVKLTPMPMTPGAAMVTVPVFSNHNAIVLAQRAEQLPAHPLGALVAGHQKDVVITPRLAALRGKVAIYGWHKTNGVPIQPLYLTHAAAWVDYSQCTRLVAQGMVVNGVKTRVADLLANPEQAALLSNEGAFPTPVYPTNAIVPVTGATGVPVAGPNAPAPLKADLPAPNPVAVTRLPAPSKAPEPKLPVGFSSFQTNSSNGERTASYLIEPEVKVHLNAPPAADFTPGKPVLLIFYTLPNGNSTAQTVGKIMKPGDDWHFDIQHIAAQTRFLRAMLTNRVIVVAYLEAGKKSWPAWRKEHGDKQIPEIIAGIQKIFASPGMETVISGHSGGGSFIFGYLNAVEHIPDDVVRIAFLDSNYAYDPALGHERKLAEWLRAGHGHTLCVLAYHDDIALYEGKTFVSAAGGTWGKSHAMLRDFGNDFSFTSKTNGNLESYSAIDGRLQLLLMQNPEKKIFHTVQVERNGFIHVIVAGTANENKGYEYFGDRVYQKLIQE